MPTTQQIPDIVEKVQQRLVNAQREGIHLKVSRHDLDEDNWLYIEVVPTTAGESASDHARLMSRIERELREQGNDQVLLVPMLEY